MPLSTQMKMMRAVQEILLGDGRNALPKGNLPKPDLVLGNSAPLPRSTPEEQGLSSVSLDSFYRNVAALPDGYAHALLVVRNGHVVSGGYFAPYRPDVWHVMHSLSKTFTGTAVGFAVEEGLFGLDDRIVDLFPERAGLLPNRRLRSITVRHLLTMSSGITFNEISEAVETDWVRGIFAAQIAFEPGSRFVYNSMNSYLLAALVRKTSGMCLLDYLRPRLLDPLGFGSVGWETCPAGTEKGGWGMYLCIEDMAKFGQLYLQKGVWTVDGEYRQLLPRWWAEQAVEPHIVSDEGEGYGYQIWVDTETGNYTMSGMFGQYVTMTPKHNMVIAMTAGNARMFTDSPAYTLMKEFFLQKDTFPARLPADPAALHRLRHTLAALRFNQPVPKPPEHPASLPRRTRQAAWGTRRPLRERVFPLEAECFCGPTWRFSRNRGGFLPIIIQATDNNFTAGVKAVHLRREDDHLDLYWEEGRGTLTLPLGFDKPRERLVGIGKETFLVASSARLAYDEDGHPVLVIEICFLEHSSFRILKLRRQDENLVLQIDERPQFMVAIESVMRQDAVTGGQLSESGNQSFTDRLFGSDFVHFRIEQLCTPELLGTPITAKAAPSKLEEAADE